VPFTETLSSSKKKGKVSLPIMHEKSFGINLCLKMGNQGSFQPKAKGILLSSALIMEGKRGIIILRDKKSLKE